MDLGNSLNWHKTYFQKSIMLPNVSGTAEKILQHNNLFLLKPSVLAPAYAGALLFQWQDFYCILHQENSMFFLLNLFSVTT